MPGYPTCNGNSYAEGLHVRLNGQSSVGALCQDLPAYAQSPPIETVTFGWGVNEDGQLGLDTDQDSPLPKVVEALLGTRLRGRQFTRAPLVTGSRNTLAIAADGQLLSWGWNARASLGHSNRTVLRKPKRVAALAHVRIVQVAIGGWHCLALDDRGQAYAWGGDEYGQCGVGAGSRDIDTPTPCVPHLRVAQVSAGGMHSCILTEDGQVWTWGEPWGKFSMSVDRQPRPVKGAHSIAKIQCGAFHNLALSLHGEVLAWGINDYGQLGNGTTTYETSPTRVPGLEGIADIAAGGWHSLALSDSGEVWTWGRGEYGRLGLGDRHGGSKLRPQKVGGALQGVRVVQAACGGSHTAALTEHGHIFTWGRASFGRLGTGTLTRDALSPVEAVLPGGPHRWKVIAVAAGGRHTLALALPDNSGADGSEDDEARVHAAGAQGLSLQSSRGASPLESEDRETNAGDSDDFDDTAVLDVPRESATSANLTATGRSDLVALVEAEEAAEDLERASLQEVPPGELPMSRVHSRELLTRAHSSPRAISPPSRAGSASLSPRHSLQLATQRAIRLVSSPLRGRARYEDGTSPLAASPSHTQLDEDLQDALASRLSAQDLRPPHTD